MQNGDGRPVLLRLLQRLFDQLERGLADHIGGGVEAMKSRKQPISDVWSHNRMLEICHLSNIAMRLGRAVQWDPVKREVMDDAQANSFLARENRKGFEINM